MEGWEGQIDVDDSDLQSVLRPQLIHSSCPPNAILNPLEPCSQISSSFQTLDSIPSIPPFQSQLRTNISEINQNEEEHPKFSISRPLIPGPAGAVQAAMRRQSAAASSKSLFPEEEGSDDLDLCANEDDGDFKLNPWLYSLGFLGLGKDSNVPYPISLINAQRSATQRIPQVVAFCPARFSCYLNITLKNVVKLIPKDCGSPAKQIMPPLTFKYGAKWNGNQLQTDLPADEQTYNTRKIAKITADATIDKLSARTGESGGLISNASVAEWTNEQLEKLFSDYEDDLDLVRPAI